MLADKTPFASYGGLSDGVHKPATFFRQLVHFIADDLPRWRDRGDRPAETAETALTSQLCAHLNSAARLSDGWDILQFRPEERDVTEKGRKIDLIAAPSGVVLHVEGRSYRDFDTLLPIECKRLPTPAQKNRDEREYVFSQHSSSGGIQRFKDGAHGAAHSMGAMIGFVQTESIAFWNTSVRGWIRGLSESVDGWSEGDMPSLETEDAILKTARLRSSHSRAKGLVDIELWHLWVTMH